MEASDILSGLDSDVDVVQDALGTAFDAATNSLAWSKLSDINKGRYSQFPGYTELSSTGTC